MPTLTLSAKDLTAVRADALVLAVASGPQGPRLLDADRLPAGLRRTLTANLAGLGVSGATDEVVRVPSGGELAAPVLALTGLGAIPAGRSRPAAETLRRAAGAATRALAGVATVALALPADDAEDLAAVAEGALLGGYAFTRYRTAATPTTKQPVRSVVVLTALARTAAARAVSSRAGCSRRPSPPLATW